MTILVFHAKVFIENDFHSRIIHFISPKFTKYYSNAKEGIVYMFIKKQIILFLSLIILIGASSYIFLKKSFDLTSLLDFLHTLRANTSNYLFLAVLIFFLVRFIFTIISVPGSGNFLNVIAGLMFDFWLGSALVIASVSLGILTVFCLTRYAFRNYFKTKFQRQFSFIDRITEKNGASFLFFLRLIDVVPSCVINGFFALTPMKISTFFWVSLAGLLPGIIIFNNAGTQITKISEASDFLNPSIAISLAVIGIIPLISSVLYKFFKSSTKKETPNLSIEFY